MNKTAYKALRVTEHESELIAIAAKLSRQSMSAFIMSAVLEKSLKLQESLPEKQKQTMQKVLAKMYSGS